MRLLVTGASGMLGYYLARLAVNDYEVWGSYRSFPVKIAGVKTFSLALEDQKGLRESVVSIRPDGIVHAAAFTDVDECETDRDSARKINVEGTAALARAAEEISARVIYISTDYVFDGKKGEYGEDDPTNPQNYYGESKLLGEFAVSENCSNGLILRTSIFGLKVPPKTGMMETLLDALAGKAPLARFADQFSSPIYTGQLSRLILDLLHRRVGGLFHVGGERVSRLQFAKEVADVFLLRDAKFQSVSFNPIAGLATRPRDSSLRSQKLQDFLRTPLAQIREGLKELKKDLKALRGETSNDDTGS
jgi:dTDP-4-dehydrorhamnose reductase